MSRTAVHRGNPGHRGHRTPGVVALVGARLLVPVLLTLLIFGLVQVWRPGVVERLPGMPLTYAIFAAAGVVVIIAAVLRIWTGSDLAAFVAEAALPAAALVLCIAALFEFP